MIPVNKPYLPDLGKYQRYIEGIYDRAWLTNNGPMVQELKARLEDYLGVKHLLPVANGTLALQLAYKALDVSGSAITTPFTFVATASSLKWEGITPQFADIDPHSLNLCPDQTAGQIDSHTSAIVPVHVYGNACDVKGFEALVKDHRLKLIYDAAHAFGVNYQGQSILNYGDASTLSFHATKVFHTVEGGAVIFKDADAYERAFKMINFGIDTSNGKVVDCGTNAKMSEVHAAMGLTVLDKIDEVIDRRCQLHRQYQENLKNVVDLPGWRSGANQNGAYMPVIFKSALECTAVFMALRDQGITARRYFSPSLAQVEAFGDNRHSTPIADDFANRALCLPLYYDLTSGEVEQVCNALKKALPTL